MRKRIIKIIAIIFIIIGIILFIFPYLSNYAYEKNVEKNEEEFIEKISDEKNIDILQKLYEELQRRNEELFESKQENLVDPFSYEQPSIDLSEYGIENNIIGYLNIPKMGINLPILLGANTENMKLGAAHLTETSYPIGGENTNCVMAAHRGYGKAAMFRNIERLEYGDKIYIQNFRERLVYEVYEIHIVTPDNISELEIKEGQDIVTLITCHPYRHNSHRYIVKAKRVIEE